VGKYARHHAVECIRDFLTPYMQQALQALSRDAPIDVARLFDDAGGTGSSGEASFGGEASFKASKPLHLLVPHVRLYISIYICICFYVYICMYTRIDIRPYIYGQAWFKAFQPLHNIYMYVRVDMYHIYVCMLASHVRHVCTCVPYLVICVIHIYHR